MKYPAAAMLVSQTVLGFGVAAALSRLLGARAFGEYAVVMTVTGIFQLVAGFPVETGIPKFLAEARQGRAEAVRRYYAAGLRLRLGACGAAMLCTVVLARWLSGAYGIAHLSQPVVLGSLSLCLLAPVSLYYLACIQGMERPKRWATASVLSAFLVFGLAVLGAVGFGGWGHRGLLALIAVGWALAAAVCVGLARGALGFLWSRTDWRYVRDLIRFLLPVWLIPLLGFGSRTILKSYLAVKQGPVPVGQFEIALTLLLHLGTVYHACMIVFVPAWARLYARRDGAALMRSISQVRGALLGVAAVYGAVLALGGQWVVPAIFGADQVGAVPAARIIGAVMPVMTGGWVAAATNIVSSRTGIMGQANIIWFCIAIPVGLAAIPSLGAAGGSVSFLAAYGVFTWFYISRARPFFREIGLWAREQHGDSAAGSV